MPAERHKALIRRLVLEAQQDGDLAVVDELLAPDFVDHSPLPGLTADREGVKQLFAAMRAAFPDLRVEILHQVADGQSVANRKRFTGTHRGPFLGVPGSGNPLDLEIIDILEFREDRIVGHWVVVDKLALLTQIGAMPAPV